MYDDPKEFDNLSNFTRDLQEIEGRDGGMTDPARANEVREGLIDAMYGYVKSLYEFAEQLYRYHKLFKAKKNSTAAMERIAKERGCSSRTLYRLLESLNKSKQLPLVFMDAMREEGIDPVRGKNQSLVETLTAAPEPANLEEAKTTLKTARAKVLKMTPAARVARTGPVAKAGRAKVLKMAPAGQEARNVPAVSATQANQTIHTTDTTPTIDTTQATDITPTTGSTQTAQTTGATGTAQIADTEIDEFATSIVRMFEERFGGYNGADRDEQIRSVLELVVNALHADVSELRIDGRLDRARKPANKMS